MEYLLTDWEAMVNKNQLLNYLEAINSTGSQYLFFNEMPITKNTAVTALPTEFVENKSETEVPQITSMSEPIKVVLPPANIQCHSLDELRTDIGDCKRCLLGATRNKLVFGEGNPNADLMVIGEAPGADEDEQGMPFVGRAGRLLTDILKAVNFERSEVYIANICKCRPPNNRKPTPNEINCCEPYLHKQIEFIKPKLILALGLTAAEALFKQPMKMSDIRGKILDYNGIQTLITYHPAALLRNPNWKRPVWEDVQYLRRVYDELTTN